MGDLLIFTVVAVAVMSLISAILPIIISIIVIGIVVFIVGQLFSAFFAIRRARIESRKIIIARADRQHKQIMSGDIEAGTYGDYPPAKY